ncbi:Argininosuccinate lyase [Thermogutta terrifontis]|uniref:Argininosuccinate lyase n=1 Tax=Thermogutta terrifontis TaxID=1331910 RepID=A0A286RD65_9BACT|nr:argininosuccinate lyase [Thermogutta terrifontis]ASV73901.1 Argininosuccinate lyase [Thermogutta terrifontis]
MTEKPWGGVFREATDRRVERFTESISFDRRLYQQDIAGSMAHARMLAQVGLLTPDEANQIITALQEIREEIATGRFPFSDEWEDIHMHIEKSLIDRLGDVGRKLHTARSRNDQVATDFRLWVRDAIDALIPRIRAVQAAFVDRCETDFDVILPGYTHLRRAQPVLAPHYWLAYCEKLERDVERLMDCRKRVNVCPLGSAAVAGTSLPIDREMTARELGFDAPSRNSIDATSDRDFAVEFVFALSLLAVHLSHWAEEWILWSTTEYGFLKLPEGFCTGSSIMPQKVNPDVLELIRGKTARVIGDLQILLVLLKGLPLAYNRDLQEDKPPVFDAYDTVASCLEVAEPLIRGAELNREAIAARLEEGHLDATTLMEYLVSRGIPQRTAHAMVGQLVREAMDRNCRLADLPLDVFRAVEPNLDSRVYGVLGVRNAVQAMHSYGSTSPDEVRRQIDWWREKLAQRP